MCGDETVAHTWRAFDVVRPQQPIHMKHAALILILVGCVVGCVADLPESEDDPEHNAGEIASSVQPTHAPDDCPGGDGGGEPTRTQSLPQKIAP